MRKWWVKVWNPGSSSLCVEVSFVCVCVCVCVRLLLRNRLALYAISVWMCVWVLTCVVKRFEWSTKSIYQFVCESCSDCQGRLLATNLGPQIFITTATTILLCVFMCVCVCVCFMLTNKQQVRNNLLFVLFEVIMVMIIMLLLNVMRSHPSSPQLGQISHLKQHYVTLTVTHSFENET